jgi:hypothetical protein
MDELKKKTKAEALARAIEMFRDFDVDDDRYGGVILMYDKKEERFRMLTINANPGEIMIMLDSAFSAVFDVDDALSDENRILN